MAADPDPLQSLHKEHPRLFWHKADVASLRESIKSDELLGRWHKSLTADAEKMLKDKPVAHVLIGPRLLDKSRTALRRISTLSALYLLDGDKRFAERAKQEMMTVVAFPDWNPSHFLDVAEMSNAVGIGYDWLFDYLSADERKTIREGLIRNGVQEGLSGFEKGAWWTKATHNWSQVCNGGLTVGALAIADEEPALAGKLVDFCRVAIKPSMKAFAPDGGCPEGPGYWNYATDYNVFYLAATESALGTDFGLKAMPGFAETGFFRIQFTGPLGKTFNYADAGDGAGTAAQMFWLAAAFNQLPFAAHELQMAERRPSIFHLIWYPRIAAVRTKDLAANPLDAVFRGVNVAFFRSNWDANGIFVGIKGGDNRANHSHLDLGCFVLDALGQRWAVDLGGDDYNLPGYFGNKRWTYYRLRTESHNTLTLDGENQDPAGKAPIVAYLSTPNRAHVVVNLSGGYRKQATKVMRGLAMLERNSIVVQDEIQAKQPVDIRWKFLTGAKIQIDGRSAVLSQGQAKLRVQIIEPPGASFEVISANPPPPQKQQPNIQNLTVKLAEKSANARIVVLIAPGDATIKSPKIEPLEKWEGK